MTQWHQARCSPWPRQAILRLTPPPRKKIRIACPADKISGPWHPAWASERDVRSRITRTLGGALFFKRFQRGRRRLCGRAWKKSGCCGEDMSGSGTTNDWSVARETRKSQPHCRRSGKCCRSTSPAGVGVGVRGTTSRSSTSGFRSSASSSITNARLAMLTDSLAHLYTSNVAFFAALGPNVEAGDSSASFEADMSRVSARRSSVCLVSKCEPIIHLW